MVTVGLRTHAVVTVLLAAALAVEWSLFLSADECGAEDRLECTTTGWILLGAWGLLVVAVPVMLLALAARLMIPRLRRR